MNITVPKKQFVAALTRVEKATDPKSNMPALGSVHLEVKDGIVTLTGTDLYVTATERVECEDGDSGSAVVGARLLLERIKAMPDGPVTVRVDDAATVLSGTTARRFTLPIHVVADYPPVPDTPDGGATFVIGAGALLDLLNKVTFSISTDDTRAHLNALKVELGGGTLRFVSTDGHRLTVAEVDCEGPKTEALVPLRGAQEIARLAASVPAEEHVAVYLDSPLVTVALGAKTVTVKEIDATFPAWQQVVPKGKPTVRASVPREALVDACKAVSIASSDRTGGIRLQFSEGTCRVLTESAERGDAVDEVPADVSGSLLVGLNAKYLIDALSHVGCEEVTLSFGCGATGEENVALDPILVEGVDLVGWRGVIMPMKV